MSNQLLPASSAPDVIDGSYRYSKQLRKLRSAEIGSTNQLNITLVQLREITASNILRLRYCFEMLWAHTRRLLAQMVDNHSFWNRADEIRVRSTMCELRPSSELESSVPPSISRCSGANPAWGRKTSIFFAPKIGSEFFALTQSPYVPSYVENGFSDNMPELSVCHLGNGCEFSATTVAVHSSIMTNTVAYV